MQPWRDKTFIEFYIIYVFYYVHQPSTQIMYVVVSVEGRSGAETMM